jgi:hydroxyacylglutathione hydrolase
LDAERRTNPFLRADDPDLKAATGTTGQSDDATFAAARHARDAF